MDTRHLEAVLAVAHHGSFTAAARETYVDPSTLSRQVGAIERDLGVALFVRGHRSLRLTREGAAFLAEAAHVLAAVGRARASVRVRPPSRLAPAPAADPADAPRALAGTAS